MSIKSIICASGQYATAMYFPVSEEQKSRSKSINPDNFSDLKVRYNSRKSSKNMASTCSRDPKTTYFW